MAALKHDRFEPRQQASLDARFNNLLPKDIVLLIRDEQCGNLHYNSLERYGFVGLILDAGTHGDIPILRPWESIALHARDPRVPAPLGVRLYLRFLVSKQVILDGVGLAHGVEPDLRLVARHEYLIVPCPGASDAGRAGSANLPSVYNVSR